MRRIAFLLLILSLFAFNAVAAGHIVLFKGSGVPSGFADAVAAAGGTVRFQHPVLALVDGLDAEAALRLGGLGGVAEVQADGEFSLDAAAGETEETFVVPDSPADPTLAGRYAWQWNMRAIGADTAWAAGKLGSSSVRVAILDTGIDRQGLNHMDLVGRVDYASGAQFMEDDPLLVALGYPLNPTDDLHFHGTHVAATVSSNAYGAAGVTSGVTVIPVKVLGLRRNAAGQWGGSGSLGAVLAGVLYAADIDADVANMSLGGGFDKMANGRYVGMINATFNYAHRKGLLVVVSAGNESIDLDHDGPLYKTYCTTPNTVCVSATGPATSAGRSGPWSDVDALASYSNYGRSAINVAAPGGDSGGFVWAACSRASLLYACGAGTSLLGSAGTSMASPHVSGLAALIVEQIGRNKPAQVKAILEQSADDLGQPGTDAAYGKGRINVPRALGLQ